MDVEEIKDKVREYLKDDLDKYAILINGGWGTGKTFLYENYLRNVINKNEVGKTDGKRDIYISLYGMRTIQELSDELLTSYIIFSKLHAQRKSKKKFEKAQTVLSMFTKSIKVNLKCVDFDISNFASEAKKLFDINQLVICFDDFERCEIPINTLFGYINNLVEHHKCKVIILADENNIGKIHANTNVEAKYSTILTGNRKLKFDDKTQKEKDKEINEELTVLQLKNYNEELYSENYLYRDIKEKVVRRTYNYYPNVTNVIKDISGEKDRKRIPNDEYRKYINSNATKIAGYFSSAGSNNLRIIFLWIKNFESIYLCAKEQISNYEYYDYILNEYMHYSIWKLVSKELNIPLLHVEHDNRYYSYYTDEVYFAHNEYSKINAYTFIDPWIICGNYDEKGLVYRAEQIDNRKRKEDIYKKNEVRSTGIQLSNLREWPYMEDQEIIRCVDSLFSELQDDKYVFRDYEIIIMLLYKLKNKAGFNNIDIKSYLKVMERLITNDNEIFDLRFLHWDYEVCEKELRKLMQLREQRNIELGANVLDEKGAYASVERFCEECNLREDYYVQNKSFMEYVNIKSLIMLLDDATLEDIYNIKNVFNSIYRMGNIKDFFLDDLERLKELEIKISEKIKEIGIKGKTYKYAIENLHNALVSIIERLE